MKNVPELMLRSVAWIVLLASSSYAGPPSFIGLGDLPGGLSDSRAWALSGDGMTVVGAASPNSPPTVEAFRWTAPLGLVGLGDIGGDTAGTLAFGVNGDGTVVVGFDMSGDGEAFRWVLADAATGAGNMIGLGFLFLGTSAFATNVTSDGSAIVGVGTSSIGQQAFCWTDPNDGGTGMVGLGTISPGGTAVAWDISDDAEVVVGSGNNPSLAWRWSRRTGMDSIGTLRDGDSSAAKGVNIDGSIIVGFSGQGAESEAFRWDLSDPNNGTGVMTGLGDLDGGNLGSGANAVTPDGAVTVGWGNAGSREAVIWDAAGNIRSLTDVLANDMGLDLTGWVLWEATGVSDDGQTIVGIGLNTGGNAEGWIATLGTPCFGDLTGDGQVDLSDLVILLGNYATPSGADPGDGDLDDDGDVDLTDLALMLSAFGTICT